MASSATSFSATLKHAHHTKFTTAARSSDISVVTTSLSQELKKFAEKIASRVQRKNESSLINKYAL